MQGNISKELLRYLKQQNLSTGPLLPAMEEVQESMDDILSRTDLSNDEKAKRYFQLQGRYLSFKQQMNTPTVWRPDVIEREEINSTFPEQISKQDSSTSKASTVALNPFNTTPKLNKPSILPKPTTVSSTPLVSNPSILTPPPTIETPSQGPKRKRRCIRFVNYLDDNVSQKQRKQTRRQRYRAEPKIFQVSRWGLIGFFHLKYICLYYSFCIRFTIKGNKVHLIFISQEMCLKGY